MTISINRLTNDLKDMKSDLLLVKNAAQHILNKVSDFKPDDVMDAGQGDMSQEDKSAISPAMDAGDNTGGSAPDEQGGMPGDEKGGDMNKAPKITTPEEAKTTLHDAIKDLKGVVEGIDNITDQTSSVEEKTSSKTFRLSSSMKSEIGTLTKQAISAIEDGKEAIKHWAFLLTSNKMSPVTKNLTANDLVSAVKQAKHTYAELGQAFGTAVAPTGAEFSGDKTLPKRPEKVEIDVYKGGWSEFESNKSKLDKLPNPASEPRLTDEGNPHEFGAYVNAKAVAKNDKFSSGLVIRAMDKDKKNGKVALVTWDTLSNSVGPKNATNYNIFMSDTFARNVEAHVRKSGIESIASYLNAIVDSFGMAKTAREPKVEDKAKIRAYFADAYGDPNYAKELTSAQKSGSELGMGINSDKAENNKKGGDDMNIAYKPEEDSANDAKGGLDGGNKADSLGTGKGTTSALSAEERTARARVAVDMARLAASRNVIPFAKTAIKTKALEIVSFSEDKFNAYKELLDGMPLVNEAAIKEARIPEDNEVEKGVVANKFEAVTKPENSMPAEGLNSDVKSDAKIKQASKAVAAVPQLQTNSSLNQPDFRTSLNTLQNRLIRKNINPDVLTARRVKAHYMEHKA